jgi:hypothetical protein
VGISAHLNLDLGIAAAETAPAHALAGLRRDFDRINEIIASLITHVEHDIAEVSPWIGLLDRIGGRHDEEIVRFSMSDRRRSVAPHRLFRPGGSGAVRSTGAEGCVASSR